MCDCNEKDCCQNSDSGFIFGMVIGAIIGAFVAVYFYKNNKTKVFDNLKQKLQGYFGQFIPQSPTKKTKTKKSSVSKVVPEKIPVILPHAVAKEAIRPKPTVAKSKKMFKK